VFIATFKQCYIMTTNIN